MSLVNIAVQKITIDDVQDIIIDDVYADAGGTFYRSIKILGTPLDGNGNGVLVLNVVVSSTVKANIAVTAPASEY